MIYVGVGFSAIGWVLLFAKKYQAAITFMALGALICLGSWSTAL